MGPLPLALALLQDWYVDANAPGCPTGTGTQADPFCDIMDAVNAAVDGDTIHLGPGTYFENVVIDEDLELIGTGGQEVTILDGGANGSVVYVLDAAVTLTGLTLTNGTGTPDAYQYSFGGGLLAQSTVGGDLLPRVTLTSCQVSGNLADYGGGLACEGSSDDGLIELIDSLVAGNAAFGGGGIHGGSSGGRRPFDCQWMFSSIVLTNSSVTGNTASGSGGGIQAGRVSAAGSAISENLAGTGGFSYQGGGLDVFDATLTNTVVERNILVTGQGGGICIAAGGAECFPPTSLSLVNVKVTDNQAPYGGGIVAFTNQHATLTNLTLSANVSTSGNVVGGLFLEATGYGGVVENSVLWHNTPGSLEVQSVTVAHSLLEGVWPGPGNIDADPLFRDPASGDFRLTSGSPCIDAGNNLAVPPGITTDLEGKPRFLDDLLTPDTGVGMAPVVDMGAYEYGVAHPRRVRRR